MARPPSSKTSPGTQPVGRRVDRTIGVNIGLGRGRLRNMRGQRERGVLFTSLRKPAGTLERKRDNLSFSPQSSNKKLLNIARRFIPAWHALWDLIRIFHIPHAT